MRSPDSKPTGGQLWYAGQLGIDVAGKTYGQLREEIDQVDSALAELALANPALRLNNHIVLDGRVYVVMNIRIVPDSPMISLRRSVSLRSLNGDSTTPHSAALLLNRQIEELDRELVRCLPARSDIRSDRLEDLFPPQDEGADSASTERPNTGASSLARLIEAVQEQTAILREISAKLDHP